MSNLRIGGGMSTSLKVGITGLALQLLGVVMAIGRLVFRIRNDVADSDIGAGMVILMGMGLAFIGTIVCLVGVLSYANERRSTQRWPRGP